MQGTVNGLKVRGKLLIVGAAFDPMEVSAVALLSGKSTQAGRVAPQLTLRTR